VDASSADSPEYSSQRRLKDSAEPSVEQDHVGVGIELMKARSWSAEYFISNALWNADFQTLFGNDAILPLKWSNAQVR